MNDHDTSGLPELNWEHAEDVLCIWLRRARESQRGHYRSANFYQALNLWLGIPAVALSTVVGTGVFISLQHDASAALKIAAGLLSLSAAVLMALHTTLNFSERSNKHKTAGAGYAAIRREMEALLAIPAPLRGDVARSLDSVRARMDKLADESPALPPKFWNQGTSYLPPAFLVEEGGPDHSERRLN